MFCNMFMFMFCLNVKDLHPYIFTASGTVATSSARIIRNHVSDRRADAAAADRWHIRRGRAPRQTLVGAHRPLRSVAVEGRQG